MKGELYMKTCEEGNFMWMSYCFLDVGHGNTLLVFKEFVCVTVCHVICQIVWLAVWGYFHKTLLIMF